MIRFARRSRPLIAFLFAVAMTSLARGDALPNELTLQYRVSLGSAELGSLLTRLRRNGDIYHADSRTRAEGVASILLGGDMRESCVFTVKADAIMALNYEVVREGHRAFRHGAEFDWSAGEIRFSNGDRLPVPDGYTVDNCSIPFAFMLGNPWSFADRSMHVVGGERIRRFTNISVTEERLATPIGEVDSIRIEQQRQGKPGRTFTVWVAPSRNNLPVKMVEKRRSRVTTMLLTSVSGL